MTTQTKNTLIFDTLNELSSKYLGDDATDFLNLSMQEELTAYKDSSELFYDLMDNGYFNEEVIYYSNAIEYLKENDASLSESLEIAEEYGCTLENINSEVLASLHASRKKADDFFEYVAPEIDKLLQ
tara:strand:+ start:299 stop:679 length:381 start_codon:yes stop_codon:yes gene_type:complete